MIEKIKELEELSRALDPKRSIRDEWTAETINYASRFLDNLDDAKAYIDPDAAPGSQLDVEIRDSPGSLTPLLEGIRQHIDGIGINAASGGHLGYIPGGGVYPSALGDYLAAVTNRYAGIFFAAPGAVRLENGLVRWMCDLMGLPDTAFGNLTSGGSIANLVAVVTAREAMAIRAREVDRCVVYLTEQAHHSMQKALRIAGMGEVQIRYIPLDEGLRMRVEDLEEAIRIDQQVGLRPFLVNASCGTTNTGAIDPLMSIAALARQFGLWFHADAAYGGFFKLVPELQSQFQGIEQADSITLDPHKTLFLPFGTGAILIRDKAKVLAAHQYLADYMQDSYDVGELSPADVSPELTKHFRGLRLWLPLKLFGLRPFRAALEEKCHLARYFYQKIGDMEGFERGPEPVLSVAMFRYVASESDNNEFNKRLIGAIQKDGRIFLSSTTIGGIFWIRVAVVLFRTHLQHIDLLLTIIREKVSELLEEDLPG